MIRIHPTQEAYHEDFFDLRDVDEANVTYYNYDHLRCTHGAAYEWNYNYVKEVWVIEKDGPLGFDLLGMWNDPTHLYFWRVGSRNTMDTYNVSHGPGDAKVVLEKTNDTFDDEIGR